MSTPRIAGHHRALACAIAVSLASLLEPRSARAERNFNELQIAAGVRGGILLQTFGDELHTTTATGNLRVTDSYLTRSKPIPMAALTASYGFRAPLYLEIDLGASYAVAQQFADAERTTEMDRWYDTGGVWARQISGYFLAGAGTTYWPICSCAGGGGLIGMTKMGLLGGVGVTTFGTFGPDADAVAHYGGLRTSIVLGMRVSAAIGRVGIDMIQLFQRFPPGPSASEGRVTSSAFIFALGLTYLTMNTPRTRQSH